MWEARLGGLMKKPQGAGERALRSTESSLASNSR
jgi:hypothetical protein